MRFAGLDIGSRTIEFIVIEGDTIVLKKQSLSGYDPLKQAKRLIDGVAYDCLVATGYGRKLAEVSFDARVITEIQAYAVGARFLFPKAKTILDIGGQDSKVIALNGDGRVVKFEMNDKCAAGTGRFLEIMADTLGYRIEEMGEDALNSTSELAINSMCTVFAESEVISLMTNGHERHEIAMAIHRSIARRAVSMLKRVMREGPIVFAGGVAKNVCMVQLIRDMLGTEVLVPNDPQMVGALGAALVAARCSKDRKNIERNKDP